LQHPQKCHGLAVRPLRLLHTSRIVLPFTLSGSKTIARLEAGIVGQQIELSFQIHVLFF
jgi:hypothetical protein